MNGKYMTVSEFAEKAGVSKQTIYDQMMDGKRLAPYKRRINGKKMIRADALSYYIAGAANDPEPETEAAPGADNPLVALLMEQIKTKDDQLRAKDEQIAEKDKQLTAKDEQIKSMTDMLQANAALQYRLQDQLARLTGEVASTPEETVSEAEKPAERQPETQHEQTQTTDQPTGGLLGWFRRLRGR